MGKKKSLALKLVTPTKNSKTKFEKYNNEQRMRIFANLIIDRILLDYSEDYIPFSR
jgi:hypothetical protein